MSNTGNELLFLPLGGAGEIGMNLNLYGFGPPDAERWMMVDLGITFNNGQVPGVDVIMPDPQFIVDRLDSLDGLVLTHAHEDHLGAVPYLWERLRCPIYATPFTASILRRKLAETDFKDEAEITIVDLGSRFSVGPFDLELITLTHSIPEPNAIAIRTPLGTVLHTGDWKFDPGPVVGAPSDKDALRRVGEEGVQAIVCDSTNVFVEGVAGSESDLLQTLREVIGKCENRVAVTSFASNVARLETIAAAALANGRDVVLAGRSLRRFDEAARENGLLADTPAFLDEDMAGYLPKDKVLIVCTGSQGESRAALSRIAAGDHSNVTLEEGDTVIFSSREIPGNEANIGRLHNDLSRLGIEVITWRNHLVHVSGHPARDELIEMYQLIQPRIAVPVHGERRHLEEHARLAKSCQVAETVVNENGGVIRLAPQGGEIIGQVPSGRLTWEGGRTVPMNGDLVRSRSRALYNGSVVVTVVVDAHGLLAAAPQIATTGLLEADEETVLTGVEDVIKATVDMVKKSKRQDDELLKEELRIAVRRFFRDSFYKRPSTSIHLVRTE
ncbi:MAG: ribonuclease J [Rhodospirillales bacterium]|nr:ribonuclease J [Rhodospirillales bacterium]